MNLAETLDGKELKLSIWSSSQVIRRGDGSCDGDGADNDERIAEWITPPRVSKRRVLGQTNVIDLSLFDRDDSSDSAEAGPKPPQRLLNPIKVIIKKEPNTKSPDEPIKNYVDVNGVCHKVYKNPQKYWDKRGYWYSKRTNCEYGNCTSRTVHFCEECCRFFCYHPKHRDDNCFLRHVKDMKWNEEE